jgi:hypothetical protein
MKKLLGLCCALALFACTKDKLAGTIDTTDTGIVGKVSYATGKAAANAKVQLFVTLDTSRTALFHINTDNNGSFTFDSLAPGSYNVWIESSDSQVAFIDSVYVPKNTQVRRDATLGKSGSITAIVGLQTGHDPQSVFVQALGTQKYSNVDSTGHFTIPSLAAGDYTLRLVSTIPGYTPTYKTISIASGVNDTLKDTIKLIYTGIPPVAGITASYDPFTGIATISWSKMSYANLYDYLIYRDIPGSVILSSAPIAASTDTVFYDTLFGDPATTMIGWPDSSIGNANIDTSSTSLKYRYRVTIRNKSNQEGLPYNFADINGTNPLNLMHVLYPVDNAKFVNGTNLSVSWNGVASAQNYQIIISSKPDFSDTVLSAIIKDTVKALPTLSLGYYYSHVRAQGPKGQWGFWSVPKKFVVNGGLFANTFGQSVNFYINKLLRSNDGGYLVMGSTSSPVNYYSGILYLFKIDSLGNDVWHQAYNFTGNAIDAFQTNDNGYLILGDSPFLLRIDINGTIVWSKTDNDTSVFNSKMNVNSLLKTPDDGFLLGVSTPQIHILKFNNSGSKQWDQMVDTSFSHGPSLLSIGSDSFAVIYLKHYYDVLGADTLSINIFDFSGKEKNSKQIFTNDAQDIKSVCKTDLGRIFVGESVMMGQDCSIIKIDPDWNSISMSAEAFLWGIQSSPGGGFIQSSNGSPYTTPSYIMTIMKRDETGAMLWSKNILPSGTALLPFTVNPDGSIVAAITLNTFSNNIDVHAGVLLFKISKDGVSFEQ